MKMWLIEDSDPNGNGMTMLLARSQREARKKFAKLCPTLHLDSIEDVKWATFSELQDARGCTGYAQREVEPLCNVSTVSPEQENLVLAAFRAMTQKPKGVA